MKTIRRISPIAREIINQILIANLSQEERETIFQTYKNKFANSKNQPSNTFIPSRIELAAMAEYFGISASHKKQQTETIKVYIDTKNPNKGTGTFPMYYKFGMYLVRMSLDSTINQTEINVVDLFERSSNSKWFIALTIVDMHYSFIEKDIPTVEVQVAMYEQSLLKNPVIQYEKK